MRRSARNGSPATERRYGSAEPIRLAGDGAIDRPRSAVWPAESMPRRHHHRDLKGLDGCWS